MPRALRAITANECYHIINRGNQKARVFHCAADFAAFLSYIREAQERVELPLLAVCLMPNHVHLVVRPRQDGDIASWVSWLFTTHVRRHHRKYGTTGRLWQGRYKSCLIQQDHHLLTVLRYVERNALAGKLVARAEDWRWGSLNWRRSSDAPIDLMPAPIDLPKWWTEFVSSLSSAVLLLLLTPIDLMPAPIDLPKWWTDS